MARKSKKYHFIYKTTDTRNGNFYIGMHSTDNLKDGYIGSGTRLRRLIYKHGKEIFKFEILEFLSNRNLLKKRESEIVNTELLSEHKCMNLKPGGSGGFINLKHQKKCSEAGNRAFSNKIKSDKEFRNNFKKLKRKHFNEQLSSNKRQQINNFSCDWTGKKHTTESKLKISKTKKGKGIGSENSQFNTCWITKNNENKKIKKEELNFYLSYGWKNGRTILK